MEKIDMVLVGAEGVVENGGIINQVGTYTIAVMARAAEKPVYAVAESYKFVREFPLHQYDLPTTASSVVTLQHGSRLRNNCENVSAAPLESASSLDQTTPSQSHQVMMHLFAEEPRAHSAGEDLMEPLHPTVDYTPPSYINLLFTDLGVLTPSGVGDELIKLYY